MRGILKVFVILLKNIMLISVRIHTLMDIYIHANKYSVSRMKEKRVYIPLKNVFIPFVSTFILNFKKI